MIAAIIILVLTQIPCPAEGRGGDPLQNVKKNRIAGANDYADWDVPRMLSLRRDYGFRRGQRERKAWPKQLREEIEQQEATAIALSGYIIGTKAGPAEPANCNRSDAHDLHLWIAVTPRANLHLKRQRTQSVVVEITPQLRRAHPSWNVRALEKLSVQKRQVRVKGWLMFDPEHPEDLDKARATLWEVHPVLEIEVRDGDRWVPL